MITKLTLPKAMNKLAEDQQKELIRQFGERKITAKEFAKQHKIPVYKLYSLASKYGVPMRGAIPANGRTREQKLAILKQWEDSGQSAPEFSETCGVTVPTLYGWRSLLGRQARKASVAKPAEASNNQSGALVSYQPHVADRTEPLTDAAKLAYIQDFTNSGLGVKEFCQKVNIPTVNLLRWRKKLTPELVGRARGRGPVVTRVVASSVPEQAPVPEHEPFLCPRCHCDIAAELERTALKLRAMQAIKF